MNYCKECGNQINNTELNFCVNCGTKLTDEEKNESAGEINRKGTAITPKKSMTKKQKKVALIVSAVAIVFIGMYFIGSFFTSPDRLINDFQEAVKEEDSEKLAETLSFNGSEKEINSNDVEGFLAYLGENPEISKEIVKSLKRQKQKLDGTISGSSDKEKLLEMFMSSSGNKLVMLQKGKGFLFYDTYELKVEPLYITLHSNFSGTKFYSGDKELGKSNSEEGLEAGPLIAGIQTIRAELKNDLMTLEKEEKTTVTQSGETMDFQFDASNITFDVRFEGGENSRVVMNGEAIQFNILKEKELGPVLIDGTTDFSVEVDFPWGTMTTGKQVIENDNVPVILNLNESLQKDLGEALQKYVDLYLDSWKNNDLTKVAGLNAELKKEYEQRINYLHEESDEYHEKQYLGMTLDRQDIEITQENGQYHLMVKVKEDTRTDSYSDKSRKNPYEDSKIYTYDFLFQDGEWAVYDKERIYGSLRDSVKLDVTSEVVTVKGPDVKSREKEKVASAAASEEKNESIEDTVINYVYNLVKAVNAGDYELVKPYIKNGSSLDKSQSDLVERLHEDDMKQEVINASVSNVEKNNDGWTVTTNETIKLTYASGDEKTVDYEWDYTVRQNGSDYALSELKEH